MKGKAPSARVSREEGIDLPEKLIRIFRRRGFLFHEAGGRPFAVEQDRHDLAGGQRDGSVLEEVNDWKHLDTHGSAVGTRQNCCFSQGRKRATGG